MIKGDKIKLVPLERGRHFENALRWMNDIEVTRFMLMGDKPMTRLNEEEWFERASKSPPQDVLFAIETLDDQHIGFSGLHRIDWKHRVAYTGTLIGRKDLWGQGFGSDAARTRTRYAFEFLNLRLLISEVFSQNVGSYKMLQKAGYRETGRIPKRLWKRGGYEDLILMVAERPDDE